jgi:hypothetical protein
MVLSPILVTNRDDSGPGSLRAAVAQADATTGAVIEFSKNLAGRIDLKSELSITSSMTIIGDNNKVTLSGEGKTRAFDIASSAGTVAMQDFNIVQGLANDGSGGGAILDDAASLTLTHMTLSKNEATGGLASGGAVLDFDGYLDVESCTFNDNEAVAGTGSMNAFGGAISTGDFAAYQTTTASLKVVDSNFSGNIAQGSAGGFAAGGAINGEHTVMNITGGTYERNKAIGGAGIAGMDGPAGDGGQAVGGGVRAAELSVAVIADAKFLDNSAQGGNGGKSTSSYPNPDAVGGAGGIAEGGGVDISFSSTGTVDFCTLSGNSAIGGNGGIADEAIVGNHGGHGGDGGTGSGGDLNADLDATLFASDDTLDGGMAIGGNGANGQLTAGDGGAGEGGGLATPQDFTGGGNATITGLSLSGDRAVGGDAGKNTSGIIDGFGGDGLGGGIYLGPLEPTTITSTSITSCLAQGGKGQFSSTDGAGTAGGLFIADGFVNDTVDTSIDALTISQITGNHASTQNDDLFGSYILIPT